MIKLNRFTDTDWAAFAGTAAFSPPSMPGEAYMGEIPVLRNWPFDDFLGIGLDVDEVRNTVIVDAQGIQIIGVDLFLSFNVFEAMPALGPVWSGALAVRKQQQVLSNITSVELALQAGFQKGNWPE